MHRTKLIKIGILMILCSFNCNRHLRLSDFPAGPDRVQMAIDSAANSSPPVIVFDVKDTVDVLYMPVVPGFEIVNPDNVTVRKVMYPLNQ